MWRGQIAFTDDMYIAVSSSNVRTAQVTPARDLLPNRSVVLGDDVHRKNTTALSSSFKVLQFVAFCSGVIVTYSRGAGRGYHTPPLGLNPMHILLYSRG